MGYVFKGTNHEDPDYMSEDLPEWKCGTRRGYRQHQNNNEEPCDPCAEAHAEYMRGYTFTPRCGTVSGHRAHVRAGETPCADCDAAAANHVPVKRVQRRAKKVWTPDRCGTTAGYRAHYYYDVPVCDECKEAQYAYAAGYREQRAA
jgi:hypothetical protein